MGRKILDCGCIMTWRRRPCGVRGHAKDCTCSNYTYLIVDKKCEKKSHVEEMKDV
jgi:hypothetical protein